MKTFSRRPWPPEMAVDLRQAPLQVVREKPVRNERGQKVVASEVAVISESRRS